MRKLITKFMLLATILLIGLTACGGAVSEEEQARREMLDELTQAERDELMEFTQDDEGSSDNVEAQAPGNGANDNEMLSQFVGIWELTAAVDANDAPTMIYFLDKSYAFARRERGASIDYIRRSFSVNNDGGFNIFGVINTMPIEELTDDKLILSDGTTRLEYTRVTAPQIAASDILGTWIITTPSAERLTQFFMMLSDDGSARFFRMHGSTGIMWRNRTTLYNDATWYLLDNQLLLHSAEGTGQTNFAFTIDEISDSHISTTSQDGSNTFVNQSALNPQSFVGTWQLQNEDNAVQSATVGTMPITLLLNNDGTGTWQEGVNLSNINWHISNDFLVLCDTTYVYFFTIVESSESSFTLSVRIPHVPTMYFEYTRTN